MSKKLNNPCVAECIESVGQAMDKFFEPHTPCTSKMLPLRADFLTFEDDAFDLGFYQMIDSLTIGFDGKTKATKRLMRIPMD